MDHTTKVANLQAINTDKTTIDKLLKEFKHSLFITPQWVESMAIDGCKPIYLQFTNANNKVVGFHAGLIVKGSSLQGTQLYFYAGPAIADNDTNLFEACLIALRIFAKENGFTKISIRPFDQQLTTACNPRGYRRTNSAEYIYEYNKDEEIRLSYGFKKNIKKGRKTGAKLLSSQHQRELHTLFSLIDQTHTLRVDKYGNDYNPLGLLNLSKESLTRLLETDLGVLYYVEVDQTIHCIQLCLEDESRNYALLMGSNEFAYQNGLGSFLDFSVEENLKDKGFKYINLGSVPHENDGGAGLIQYKEAMGCKRFNSYGYYTYFLTYPHRLFNPLYKLGNHLPDNRIVSSLKSMVSKLISKN